MEATVYWVSFIIHHSVYNPSVVSLSYILSTLPTMVFNYYSPIFSLHYTYSPQFLDGSLIILYIIWRLYGIICILIWELTYEIKWNVFMVLYFHITGFRFDFNSLKKQAGYTVMGSDSHKYVINVCDALASSVCDGSDIGTFQTLSDWFSCFILIYSVEINHCWSINFQGLLSV